MTKTQQRQHVQQLIDVLRSGQYPQGKAGYLRTETGFCCQGVGCDLVNPEGWSKQPWFTSGSYDYDFGQFADPMYETPSSLYMWRKIGTHHYGIAKEDSDSLAGMNDGRYNFWYTLEGLRCSFEEIADCLELLLLADLVGENA